MSHLRLGLEDRLDNSIGSLSGGQRQALTLLMASWLKPRLLLLDEHTAALDPRMADHVINLSEQIASRASSQRAGVSPTQQAQPRRPAPHEERGSCSTTPEPEAGRGRRQISATEAALPGASVKSGRTPCARATNKASGVSQQRV